MRFVPLSVVSASWIAASSEARAEVSAEAGTAIEALPDLQGSSYARARHDLLVEADVDGGISVVGAGNVHHAPLSGDDGGAPVTPDESDLQRLNVAWRGVDDLAITVGRFVDTTSGGPARVDGASVRTGSVLPVELSAWGGRLGHVEPTEPTGAWGGGANVGWSGTGVDLSVGGTLVQDADVRDLRAGARGGLVSARGATLRLSAEYGTQVDLALAEAAAETGSRAGLRFRVPVGPSLSLDGGARWNGLAPIWLPPTALGALEALAPSGYAIGDLGITARAGDVVFRGEGGPTWHAEEGNLGLTGRLSSEVVSVPGHPGVFLTTSAIGESWYAGGGVGASDTVGSASFGLDAGLFRMGALSSAVGWVGEGRLHVGWSLAPAQSRARLRVVAEAAAGTDRLLAPWYRGGLALRGALGKETS